MTGWWAAAFVAQWIVVLVLAVVIVALARQVGTLHLRLGPRGALEVGVVQDHRHHPRRGRRGGDARRDLVTDRTRRR